MFPKLNHIERRRNFGALSVEYGTLEYFLMCGLGGIFSCGLTHALVVPLDLMKTRLQVDRKKYKTLANAFKVTIKEEGAKALIKGWQPTLIGFSIQGAAKFGFYEFFKVFYSNLAGKDNAYKWRTTLYLTASASAEFIADVGLAPWEATRVRMQTGKGYPKILSAVLKKMVKEEGRGVFFRSLGPLWARQIPYTMMKFACFERTLEMIYKHVVIPYSQGGEVSKISRLAATFTAGYIAGIFCAVVSHPADTVVSKMSSERGLTPMQVAKKLGYKNIWNGLATRILMIGTLTALQWFIYDFVKVALSIPRPPMSPEEKKK